MLILEKTRREKPLSDVKCQQCSQLPQKSNHLPHESSHLPHRSSHIPPECSHLPPKCNKLPLKVKNQVKSSKTRALRRGQKESDTDDSGVPEKISKTVKNQVKSPKTRSQRKRQIESVTDDPVVPDKISKTVKNEVDKPKTMSQRRRQKAVNTINTDKTRIRKAVRCEICGVPQQNIWRHMKRAHDTAIQKEDKVKSPKGYITYICPALRRIKGCPATKCRKPVERLRDHLVRTHKIPNGSKQLINLMHKAEPLRKEKPSEKKVREEVDTVLVIDSDDDNVKIKQEHVKIEPEEVKVKAESYISVSDSESHISYEATQVESSDDDIMYAQTQKAEVEEQQQSEVISLRGQNG
ncbi:unnamed protein product [Mytilus coruscus]|uniref:Uncharacterized protein n=1 Tax=Mytilus coruscus TaxID=42192 RepID=A0A6J8EEH9_MYTCO|nr:unnamed protein product [Mytilus coruscus]